MGVTTVTIFLALTAITGSVDIVKNIPSCSGSEPCSGGDPNNVYGLSQSTNILGTFSVDVSNRVFVNYGNSLEVAEGASIQLDVSNDFWLDRPGANVVFEKDSSLTAEHSYIRFHYLSTGTSFTATFGGGSKTTLNFGAAMRIEGSFTIGQDSILSMNDHSRLQVTTASSRFLTGDSANVTLGTQASLILEDGHSLSISAHGFLSFGAQSSYNGRKGEVKFIAPDIGIIFEAQSTLNVEDSSFCLVSKTVTVAQHTTLTLSAYKQPTAEGIFCVGTKADMQDLENRIRLSQ